jgi:hypothetical protein
MLEAVSTTRQTADMYLSNNFTDGPPGVWRSQSSMPKPTSPLQREVLS